MNSNWKQEVRSEIQQYKVSRNLFLDAINDERLNVAKNSCITSQSFLKSGVDELINEIDNLSLSIKDKTIISFLKKKKTRIMEEATECSGYNVLLYLDEKAIEEITSKLSPNKQVVVNFEDSFCSHYPNLANILFFSGSVNEDCFESNTGSFMEYCAPDSFFAEECNEAFYLTLVDIFPKISGNKLNADYFVQNIVFSFYDSKKEGLKLALESKSNIKLLSDSFLNLVVQLLDNEDFLSIIDIALEIRRKNNVVIDDNLTKFRQLYNLTDSQILVFDQKYMENKRVNRENIERKRKEKEAREEQARIQREMMIAREEEERRQWMEEGRRIKEDLEREFETRRIEEDRERQRREMERQHEEQVRADKERNRLLRQQALSSLDAQIAALKREAFNLNGPNDSRRRQAVEHEIDTLEREKLKYK